MLPISHTFDPVYLNVLPASLPAFAPHDSQRIPPRALRLNEFSCSFATSERRGALFLAAHGDGTGNPINASITALAVVIGHPGTDLLIASRTALHGTTIATSDERSGDHHTAVAVLDSSLGSDRALCRPSTTELDTKLCRQSVGNECGTTASSNGDCIGNSVYANTSQMDNLQLEA